MPSVLKSIKVVIFLIGSSAPSRESIIENYII
jgi:hypothetical protein